MRRFRPCEKSYRPLPLRLEQIENRIAPAGLVGPLPVSTGFSVLGTEPASQPGKLSYLDLAVGTYYGVNEAALAGVLAAAPFERTGRAPAIVTLPTPTGSLARFQIVEVPTMEPALAAQFPSIHTYRGQGIDDPAAIISLDVSPDRFDAFVLSPQGDWSLTPYWHNDTSTYVSFFNADQVNRGSGMDCELDDAIAASTHTEGGLARPPANFVLDYSLGTTLRTYRLALAADAEYTAFQGGAASVPAELASLVNRVNAMYERDLCVRFTLVAGNNSLTYTNAATDPYTDANLGAMLGENQTTCDTVIGAANYEIGHVLGTNAGGLAGGIGIAGKAGLEGQSASCDGVPDVTNQYFVTRVAHEIGHMFGGNHTFNTGAFGGARVAGAAYERGNGSTALSYALAGAADKVSNNRDEYFHTNSINEMLTYITVSIPGVGSSAATGNTVPTVNAGIDYIVPAQTPLILTATGADANGDAITYCWEEMDLGPAAGVAAADNGSSPLFRSYPPTTNNFRYLPQQSDLLGNTTSPGELLPTVARTMNFRSTVRDNKAGGGAVITDDAKITVVNTGAAFRVTFADLPASFTGGSSQTVTWDVAGTSAAPISAANVDIYLSTDGGLTWPTKLLAGTPNDGSQAVTLPNISTGSARLKVQGASNIFFDVNNSNITITKGADPVGSISGRVYDDLNANGTDDAEPGIGGRTVYIDSNANGRLDFGGDAYRFASENLPMAIDDNVHTKVPLTVSGFSGTVSDIDVSFAANHTYDSDLEIALYGPTGVKVLLSNNRGGSGDNFTGTTFDDEAATAISAGAAPFTGRFTPDQPLSVFDGLNPNGTWYIEVDDQANADIGTIEGFNLTIARTDVSDPDGISDFRTTLAAQKLSGLAGKVSDVDVSINITHTYDADLDIFLIGPTGAKVELTTDNGIGVANFTGTIFDDEAATAITAGAAPYTGRYRPEGLLSALDGTDPNGLWTLSVFDDAGGDVGTIVNWSLAVSTDVPSTNVPVPIPDLATATSTLDLAGVPGTIADLEVTVDISHTWDSDIDMFLVSPGGTKIELSTDNGSSGDNFTATIFDDEAATSITVGVAPFTGRFIPETPLSVLDGTSPNGKWTLEVTDDESGIAGTINGWSLSIQTNFTSDPDAIPGASTLLAPFLVSGYSGKLSDLDVGINLTHTWDSDVSAYLVAPGGAKVELTSGNGSSGDNYTDTIFDDEAATAITAGAAPFTGRFVPEGSLAAFDGSDPNGTWYLEVVDAVSADSGTLNGWWLTLGTDRAVADAKVPVPPAGTTGTTVVTIPASGLAGPVVDVDVSFDLQHTYIEDLAVYLTSPTGTKVELFNDVGGNRGNFVGTIVDDSAPLSIIQGEAPFTGSYRPEQPLSALRGETGNGTWTLTLVDEVGGDLGTLDGWSVTLRNATTVANTTPVPIPGASTITSKLTVTGASGLVNDLDVALDITHTWDADVSAFLIGPNGAKVELTSGNGGSADNYTGTIFDDEAATAVTAGAAPFTGRFRPEGSLQFFDGINPNGEWTLEVTDAVAADVGTLNAWSISFSTGERFTTTLPDGSYSFQNLPAGTFRIRADAEPQTRYRTQPVPGPGYNLTLNAGDIVTGQDFGSATDNTAPTGDIIDIAPDPRNSSVAAVVIAFSEAITGLTVSDLTLSRNGGPNLLTGSELLSSGDGGMTWVLDGLDPLTGAAGNYTIFINSFGSGITDKALNEMVTYPVDSWTVDKTAPTITSVLVNSSFSGQRSVVRSMLVTFSEVVTLPGGAPLNASAFEMRRTTGAGAPVNAGLSVDLSGSTPTQTIAKITFSSQTEAADLLHSLIDGKYTFTVFAGQVQDLAGNSLAANDVTNLHRLFGDSDGDNDVDATDYGAFRTAFGGPAGSIFDFDGDGDVDTTDFGAFRARFGLSL